jgi:hypothetical protein
VNENDDPSTNDGDAVRDDAAGTDEVGTVAEEAAKLIGALSGWARGVEDHLATGAAECTYCPVCRTVHALRQTTPEVRTQLATAATALLQAASGLLATAVPDRGHQPDRAGVEHIDLDDAGDWPDEPDDVRTEPEESDR